MSTPLLDTLVAEFTRLIPAETLPPVPTPAPVPAAPASPEAVPSSAEAAPAAPPVPVSPVQVVDFKARGFHLDVKVPPAMVVEAAQVLDRHGFGMDTITGVDWMTEGQMEVVYDFFHPTSPLRVVIRARIPRDHPEIATISEVFPGANWHERETHDFFGIRFAGHPDLSPFLLPEDADYHPLRKDFNP